MKTTTSILTKILLGLFIILCFYSCNKEHEDNVKKIIDLHKTSSTVNGYYINVIEYDRCEYLVSGVGSSQMITHKGNCKYCKNDSLK